MSPLEWFGLAIAAWIVFHISLVLYNIFLHPLRKYPGPVLDSATQLPYAYHMIKGDGCKYIAKLHERYGDVVRVGPNELSYISASANRTILGKRPTEETVYEKNPVAWLQGSGKISNIFFARFREHTRYRKLMAPAFSEAAIQEQEEPVIQKFVDQFMDGMRQRSGRVEFPDSNGVVNLDAWYKFIVFDTLTRLSFGAELRCLEHGDYHPWLRAVHGAIKHSHDVQAAHRLKPYRRLLERCIPSSVARPYATHLEFSHMQLAERQTQDIKEHGRTARTDFASFIFKGLTQEELEDNVNILVTAGGDTTAATLSSMTYYITHNRDCYRKLTQEIRDTFQEEREITVTAVNHLKYLKAVVKETLRIHPAIPVGLHRVVPKKVGIIDGQRVPGGTWVSVANLAAYRTARHWRDPERFIPERWLGADPAFVDCNRDVCTPFSIGVRSCIGVNLANVNLRLITARLLWNFDLHAQPDNVDPHDHLEYGVWEGQPLRIRVSASRLEC